ncbi:MAG: amidohydrolase family protein, partial [Solirubrobacterales bacterium]
MTPGGGDLCVVNASIDGKKGGLRAEAGVISEIGPEVNVMDGESVFDADGSILVPPLINGHTHAAMTLFRGHGDDLPLMRWLQEAIWPVEANLDPDDAYWGTRLACLEMIRTGTSKFWDMYWQPEAVARAVVDSGLRAVLGPPMIDPQGDAGLEGRNETVLSQLDALAGFGSRVDAAVAPHSIYTVATESLEFAVDTARQRELPIHIHLS